MEMTYGGALVMPNSYAMMDEEEMMYLEGGGTFRIIASASTVRTIIRGGLALVCGLIGSASAFTAAVSAVLGVLVFDFIIDVCDVKFFSINKSWTAGWLPDYTCNLDKYVD